MKLIERILYTGTLCMSSELTLTAISDSRMSEKTCHVSKERRIQRLSKTRDKKLTSIGLGACTDNNSAIKRD